MNGRAGDPAVGLERGSALASAFAFAGRRAAFSGRGLVSGDPLAAAAASSAVVWAVWEALRITAVA